MSGWSDFPIEYRSILERNPIVWPNGATLALWIIPNVESFRIDKKLGSDPTVPNVSGLALREYGARVGIFRLMELFDTFDVPVTAALNSDVCERYPAIIQAGMERDWEWMGHNETNSIRLTDVAPDEESRIVSDTLRVIESATGTRPVGWLSSGLQETERTAGLLVEEGLEYVADWVCDDQPCFVNTKGSKKLVSLPYSMVINDKPAIESWGLSPMEFALLIKLQFDRLYEESRSSARVMAIALHPYICGQPCFFEPLSDALAHIGRHEGVWKAHGRDIVRAYAQSASGN